MDANPNKKRENVLESLFHQRIRTYFHIWCLDFSIYCNIMHGPCIAIHSENCKYVKMKTITVKLLQKIIHFTFSQGFLEKIYQYKYTKYKLIQIYEYIDIYLIVEYLY